MDKYIDVEYELGSMSRLEIRQSLYKRFKDNSLLDLNSYPKTTDPYISITHTDGCSGWASSYQPIGFDVEKTDRPVEKGTLLRISKEDELKKAPNPIALWVAKEAALKSLWRSEKALLVSQIEVQGWEAIEHSIYRFKFSNINNLDVRHQGWLEVQNRFTLGIALSTA